MIVDDAKALLFSSLDSESLKMIICDLIVLLRFAEDGDARELTFRVCLIFVLRAGLNLETEVIIRALLLTTILLDDLTDADSDSNFETSSSSLGN